MALVTNKIMSNIANVAHFDFQAMNALNIKAP